MVSRELLHALRDLDRTDKLHVMQFLVSELARDEGALLQPEMDYSVWSPYDAFEAADTLLQVLREVSRDE